ncbi:MAG TPA: MBL fold metallo-hydrolase [Xanthobacteraceae bacterium]|nr:MBL fold metallo-hydrolase [Xanthobacteraceae bacterium]
MRAASAFVLMAILGLAQVPAAHAADNIFRVTLLGSGVPDPQPDRFSASTLIEAGDQKFMVDVGRGATIRLYQLKVPLSKIDVVFFTHYHSDHTVGMPDLLLTGWLPPAFAHRTQPMHVIGPTGAKTLMSGLAEAYAGDIKGREQEQHLPPAGVAAEVEEFTQDGVVYDHGGVKVTAFAVEHGIKPAVGYRIDYDGRSVVFSGDTNFSENLIKYATGADLVIHEVAVFNAELLKLPAFQHIQSIHVTPSQAGTVFARVHPKLAVYSHIVQLGTPTAPPPGLTEIVSDTRKTYQGPLAVGEDLMAFDIGSGGVAIYRGAR